MSVNVLYSTSARATGGRDGHSATLDGAVAAAAMVSAAFLADQALAQPAAPVKARNVVLVHGAWADESSWSEVIPLLQAAGLHVTAVQNPLTSLPDAVAGTRRVLALQAPSPVSTANGERG